ncbi:unnamed protein product [Effrenium voratum]|nr:unnamed protein product [Effrenium voratum]
MYSQKLWQVCLQSGNLNKVRSDGSLPLMKVEGRQDMQERDQDTARQEAEKTVPLPYEDMTASLLDETIYPRRPPSRDKDDAKLGRSHKLRKQPGSTVQENFAHSSAARGQDDRGAALVNANKSLPPGSRRLIQFRQKILDKFSTMKSAFEMFASEHGPHGGTKELSKKEFSRFLFRHFTGLPKEVFASRLPKTMAGASAVGCSGRNYRGEVPMNITERFQQHVIDAEDAAIKPVFCEDGISFAWIQYNNLYLLAVTQRNSNATLIVAFLYRLAEVLRDYFNELEEESIKDNFVITYELLDEMMDNGYPQTTEVKILREYIKTQSHQLSVEQMRPPTAVTNAVSWRSDGIKHKKNEIFLDVVERLNLLVSANGSVLRSEILGALKMKSYLSGMPELKLGLNDKLLFEATGRPVAKGKSVEMEDIKFHQCVQLARFENDRTISFIPPDGEFELMSYRLNTHVKPLIWVEAVVDPGHSRSRIEYMIKAKSQFKSRSVANNVEIHIPVPSDVDSPSFKTSIGTVRYIPDQDCIVWSIKQFQGQKDFIMTANFGLPSVGADNRDAYMKAPMSVKFEIPYFTVSGVTVRYLKIVEKSGYQALPWVRYITQNGDYQLRMARLSESGSLHSKFRACICQDASILSCVSLDEFHTAIEAAAPVKSLEDLRRKWVALGYPSMRQALMVMELNKDPGRSFTLQEFGAQLSRVGVEDEMEHQNIFTAIRDPFSFNQTVTLEMLAAAMSAISPSLLLEDLREKILRKFGSLSNCFAALDMDQGDSLDIGEFIRYAVPAWKLTTHEAAKVFRLIDVDGSLEISKDEFVTALTLSEPNLYLDEIRRKVRQRFRSMRGLLSEDNDGVEVDEVLDLEPPPAVEIAPSRRNSLYQRHSLVAQGKERRPTAVSRVRGRSRAVHLGLRDTLAWVPRRPKTSSRIWWQKTRRRMTAGRPKSTRSCSARCSFPSRIRRHCST